MRQTDFSNDEAVGFLADRLNRLGVEDQLLELGAEEGDAVLIGDADNAVVFDFEPMVDAGAELLGRRGEDHRFEESRPAAVRRRADRRGDATERATRPAPTWPGGSASTTPTRPSCSAPTPDWGWTRTTRQRAPADEP